MDSKSKSLEEFKKKLGEQKTKLRSLSKKQGSLLHELKDFSVKIEDTAHQIQKLEEEKKNLADGIRETEVQIGKLRQDLSDRDRNVKDRLVDLYIYGQPSYAKAFLASKDPTDLRQKRYLVRSWIEHDRKMISTFQKDVETLTQKKRSLEKQRKKHSEVIRMVSQKQKILEKEKNSRSDLLSLVMNQRDYYERSIRELEAAAKDLERLIHTLRQRETEEEGLFASMRGKLLYPVKGKIEKRFGSYRDPKFNTELYHKGLDFKAKAGAPIRAVFDGKVIHSGWFTGYGKILIIDHGGAYFSLYAHASKLLKNVGDAVTVGEKIAEVGDTGSFKGDYLYFELRHKGVSQDPAPWFAN